MQPRARDLGIEIGRLPTGPDNAITDVPGTRVGHTTLIEGEDVRTGVTIVAPPVEPLFAGAHRINGNGELTGLEWVRDSGLLTTPIGLTNTHSVGVVRDALVAAADARRARLEPPGRRRDLGRLPERHQRLPRQGGARPGRARAGGRGTCGGGRRRRRHRHGLPRLQGRDRHLVTCCPGRLDGRRPRAGQPRPAAAPSRERRSRRREDRHRMSCRCRESPRAQARSSS